MALLEFMKKYHPEDMENLNMISVCFGMYREAARHLEDRGRAEIERIKFQLSSKSISPTVFLMYEAYSAVLPCSIMV